MAAGDRRHKFILWDMLTSGEESQAEMERLMEAWAGSEMCVSDVVGRFQCSLGNAAVSDNGNEETYGRNDQDQR